jgi:hypothetical protein
MPSFSPGRWWRRDARHAEVDRGDPGEPTGLVSFLAEERQGEVDAFDFAEPALGLRSGPEVALDLVKAGQHLRINEDGHVVLGGGEAGVAEYLGRDVTRESAGDGRKRLPAAA